MKPKFQLVARCCDGTATLCELETLYEHDREITFETFARHVDLKAISDYLGYAFGNQKGLHLRKDWAIRVYKSKFRNKLCYHLDWSSIDHIFA